jgi:hypothetical protein
MNTDEHRWEVGAPTDVGGYGPNKKNVALKAICG